MLLTVDRDGPMRLSELAEQESLNPTMLSRAISQLVDDGLLERVSDDGDRRAAWVHVTADRPPARRAHAPRAHRRPQRGARRVCAPRTARLLEQALPALEALAEQLLDRRP